MKLLKRYERHIRDAVEADRAAGGSGFFTAQAYCLIWLLPLTLGTALSVNLINSVLGRLFFAAPFIVVSVVGMIVATRAGLNVKD